MKINPRLAVSKSGDCELTKANQACYDVCSAFSKSSNAWDINPDCEQQCQELVNDMRIKTYGVGWCDHHAPNRPVIWNSSTTFFPQYLEQTKNVKQALGMCLQRCKLTNTPNECRQRCLLHSYAVVEDKSNDKDNIKNNTDGNMEEIGENYVKPKNCSYLWIILLILTIIVFCIFYNKWRNN